MSKGECLIDLESENDVREALKKANQYMGSRYIESKISIIVYFCSNLLYYLVFRATNYEYNFFVKHKGMISWREPVIRMNGLPYTCTMADVQNFFEGIFKEKNSFF